MLSTYRLKLLIKSSVPMQISARIIFSFIVVAGFGLTVLPVSAQSFGRNKVQYDDFDFQVIRTEHFDIYYYPESEEAVRDAAKMAERWYQRHSRTFSRSFKERKPIIFYANDADFQQTNIIGGSIGEGTGGVTEGLKQRVVMPLTGSYSDTDHVLGHELVHSFQYDIAFSKSDTIRFAINLLPLWFVEGMAEYLSVGREDTHTAMWIRDAVIRDDLPTMDKLSRDMSYFPYRYGQAYLAYIGGKYGDAAVTNLYKLAGRAGLDSALVYTLGIKPDSLSNEWIQAVKEAYLPTLEGRTPAEEVGQRILAPEIDAGEVNISPAVSPDGKYVAFLSERDLFNINLFIADAETGEVVKKLSGGNRNTYFDDIRFINSSGSWSPDGKQLAFITFVQGDNEISILDVDSRNIVRRIAVEGITAIVNPAWSPDGKTLAFAGLEGGISDLYLLDLETGAVTQMTDDRYTMLQPAWSPDGRTISFVTDRGDGGTDFSILNYGQMRLGLIDVESREIQTVYPFGDALHHNPQFSPDGRSLYFISDQDGFKDVYRYVLDTKEVFRVTNITTGISGITALSPAMSVAMQSGRMMFSVFSDSEYTVYALDGDDTMGYPLVVNEERVTNAGVLPPIHAVGQGLVSNYLKDPLTGLPTEEDENSFQDMAYKSRLQLDYVAPPTVGVAVGGPFGTGVAGGVGFYFSDMLGNKVLSIAAQANGTIKDVGAQTTYLNLGNRFNYGAAVGHIPILYGSVMGGYDPFTGVQIIEQLRQRIFVDQVSLLAQYPFTTTRRFETSGGFVRYGFDYEIEQYLIAPNGAVGRDRFDASSDRALLFRGVLGPEPDPIYFFHASAAYVGDFSFFGFTSPIRGGRYRFEVSPQIGSGTFTTLTADYRRYFFFNPFTFAVRGLHVGNYGANSNDIFSAEYLGYAYYPGFIRGYNLRSLDPNECTVTETGTCAEFARLIGTHIATASAELRFPLFGSETFGFINFPYLPTEISLFTDIGIAWTHSEKPHFIFTTDRNETRRIPVVSSGVSARINIMGYMVMEIFYAYPFHRPEKGAHFGLQLMPGW